MKNRIRLRLQIKETTEKQTFKIYNKRNRKVIWAHTQITSDNTNKTGTRHDVEDEKHNQQGNRKGKKRPRKSKHKTRRTPRQRHIEKQDTQVVV